MTETAGLDLLIDYEDLEADPWRPARQQPDRRDDQALDSELLFLLEIPAWFERGNGHREPLWFRAGSDIAVQTAHGTFIGRATDVAWIGDAGSPNSYRVHGQVQRYHPPEQPIAPWNFQEILVYIDLGDGYQPENVIPVSRCELQETANIDPDPLLP